MRRVQGVVDLIIGIGLLPVIVVTGVFFLGAFALGHLAGKAWEHEAEERGRRSTWRG